MLDGKTIFTKNNGQTLVFKKPDLKDEGEYECIGLNGVRGEKKYKISVKVGIVPAFKKNLSTQARIVEEGTKVTFDCDIFNRELVNFDYRWFFNSEYITPHPSARKRQEGSKLIIDSAQITDTGNYACRSSSKFGSAYGQTTLNVICKFHHIRKFFFAFLITIFTHYVVHSKYLGNLKLRVNSFLLA